MLLPSDINKHTIFISRTSDTTLLVVEVLVRIDSKHEELIGKWKESLIGNVIEGSNRNKQYLGVVIGTHALCNYFRFILHEPQPFFISVRSTNSVLRVREWLRSRVRTLSKGEEVSVVFDSLDVGKGMKALASNRVSLHKESGLDSLKNNHLSLILSRSYLTLNKNNKYITLIHD